MTVSSAGAAIETVVGGIAPQRIVAFAANGVFDDHAIRDGVATEVPPARDIAPPAIGSPKTSVAARRSIVALKFPS